MMRYVKVFNSTYKIHNDKPQPLSTNVSQTKQQQQVFNQYYLHVSVIVHVLLEIVIGIFTFKLITRIVYQSFFNYIPFIGQSLVINVYVRAIIIK